MSRIGRMPIVLEKGVKATLEDGRIKLEGPKGKLETKVLEINGVGYRAEARASQVNMTLGYSHPIVYQLPPGVTAKVDRQVTLTLESADKQLLGSVAAEIRALRPPEPYKGKGIKYSTETIRRKAGKAAAGASAG